MTSGLVVALPQPAPARVLACGAFLKNTACLLVGREVRFSGVHGDLSDPAACVALERSIDALLAQAGGRIDAVAHDLHPDFHSTRVALRLAARLGVPAIAVQHHHAHLAVVQAEHGLTDTPLVGLALDGVGLGSDGTAWGGEVLELRADGTFERVAHLPPLALPGGDVAAREPWRMAAAALQALGRSDEIVPRFGPRVGEATARGVRLMLDRRLNSPTSTAAGRWFDAAAGALGLSLRQGAEAEAAMALEAAASAWLAEHRPAEPTTPSLDLLPLLGMLFDTAPAADEVGAAAARFHLVLADALATAARRAAERAGAQTVALGGGCFFNRVLSARIEHHLAAAGLPVLRPRAVSCGDAGLALGQAWAAALQIAAARGPGAAERHPLTLET